MSHDNHLLSVLVPAFNAERYLSFCVKSLILQTYHNIEILICDDGSNDNTWRVMMSFQDNRISLFRNDGNIGKNRTCAFLLEKAKGEFITVHDADDVSAPTRFEEQMAFLIDNPEYVMCGTNFVSFLNNGKVIRKSNLATGYERIRNLMRTTSQFHGPTIVFKKRIIPEVGGFYRYFTRAEDIDLTMRMAEKFKVANLPTHLYYYRLQPLSLTNEISGYGVERLAHFSLLYHLADERRSNNGVDSLMTGDNEKVEWLVDKFKKEYAKDPDIALRRGAFRLLHMGMYRNALRLSGSAMLGNWSMLNIKCFVYAILHSVKGTFQLLLQKEKIDLSFLK